MKFISPSVLAGSFTCPNCGVISKQEWWSISLNGVNYGQGKNEIKVGTCQHCQEKTLWIFNEMYFPNIGTAEFPNPEMPESVKSIYLEAASIHYKSPRGAAALLRLAIQLLCKELGEPGLNINTDIGNLVKKGLPTIVQQSLDIVRVTGNDAVHPGVIDTDDEETVRDLFSLINVVVEYMIALPKKVSGIYTLLPPDKLKGITTRDS